MGKSYTVRKGYHFSHPQPGCHLPNSPWPGIIKLFPARESLVSDIPARDGKIIDLFLQCRHEVKRMLENEVGEGESETEKDEKGRNKKGEMLEWMEWSSGKNEKGKRCAVYFVY
jgi:hypothetical protein